MIIIKRILSQIHNSAISLIWMNNSFPHKLDHFQSYLKKGVYIPSIYRDGFYKNGISPIVLSRTFSSRYKYNKMLAIVLKFICRVHSKKVLSDGVCFQGQECVCCSSGKEYKFFDYEKQMVLTYYMDLKKQERINKNRCIFANYFSLPNMITYNTCDHFIIESLIKQLEFDKSEAFECILKSYDVYIKDSDRLNDSVYDMTENIKIFQRVFGKSKLFNDIIIYPSIYAHGDMWSSNIMYDGNTYYLTDFENCGERYFYYDFFTYLFSEWLLNKDASLLCKYFKGGYDTWLIKTSASVNCTFNVKSRGTYFLYFLVEMYAIRWQHSMKMNSVVKKVINQFLREY